MVKLWLLYLFKRKLSFLVVVEVERGKGISLGVKGLNLELPSNELIFVRGKTGVGKTFLCLKAAEAEALKGRRVIYFSTNEDRESILKKAGFLGIDFRGLEARENLKLIDYSPMEVKRLIEGGALIDEIEEFGYSLVIIDSFGFILSSFNSNVDALSFSFSFFNLYKKLRVSFLLTGEKESDFEHISHNLIYLEEGKMRFIKSSTQHLVNKSYEYVIGKEGIELKQA